MINIHPEQTCLQIIVWKKGIGEPIKTYELTTVICGPFNASYLAKRTLKQLAMDEANNFPLAAPVMMSDCYMDDILSGSVSIEEEYDAFLESDETKALGIIWNPKLDCFIFRIEQQRLTSFTKRMVFSTIPRIFNPLGLLRPLITWAKIFMQRLWLLELGWSDELPFKEENEWRQFIDSLEAVNNISIDRCIVIHRAESIEIHAFSDASEKACEFLADSTIVISWIHRQSRELKASVANRVSKIHQLSSRDQWHHIASEQNSTDVLSRVLLPEELRDDSLW
ncbi:integrase_H2C2 domain-containing protein [Trichonephila clavipes]|nr:integrase_H2C2 domain-containing protein [Trichonephila clavipes]